MTIEMIRLIEEALVGGRNGEMTYIENNPLIANIFREYVQKNKGKNFTDFLQECISENEDINKNSLVNTSSYSIIEKRVSIDTYSEEYKSYKAARDEVQIANNKLNKAKETLAKSLDEVLYKISTYEVDYGEYAGWYMLFKIHSKIIQE